VTFGTEKLEWCGYPEKNEDAITRFDTIHECDRQQDRRTLRQHRQRLCIASRSKICEYDTSKKNEQILMQIGKNRLRSKGLKRSTLEVKRFHKRPK